MNISHYDIEIKRHALIRAMQRGITPDIIEATIRGGKIKKHGKNYVRFYQKYKRGTIVCIGELKGTKIKILTITIKLY
ncbi:DUF4258 domain-containing protein [Candidatus Woesearchaeota archaeon]|jgi:hypothetical protein|nr:DUF4258 domain-containing protein [Candidatus Woesearchaeota archaeon]MBT5272524.1 DUF4258 domain-containing protein [Candidatus Woesearchaeota archaeon]MBT6041468.1 DUF4258 domain-containing protein [Candidatus Woesearchaeota archaeon]MBT6336386.1 DUF4258 domain-containing protein [Candidatus Woesearchaeota archaeon]MBT7927707.1 DUF4258 domain-containing protein [Candidatus Woesearchaeota archaeon]